MLLTQIAQPQVLWQPTKRELMVTLRLMPMVIGRINLMPMLKRLALVLSKKKSLPLHSMTVRRQPSQLPSPVATMPLLFQQRQPQSLKIRHQPLQVN